MASSDSVIRERRPLILWGATGQALVLAECLRPQGFEVVAVFDNDDGVASPFPGVPIHHGMQGFSDWNAQIPNLGDVSFAVAIGGAHGAVRFELFEMLRSAGLRPITAVHSTSFIATDAEIGEGSQILAQSAVAAAARLGSCSIVNTGATVDHECRLGVGVHICPGAHLAGCVTVGDFATIGTGAIILPRLHIGCHAHVGAGAVVTRSVPDGAVVVGNPARILDSRRDGALS